MPALAVNIIISQRHPFSTVACCWRFASRDKISHYFDRLICHRLYYDAEITLKWSQEIWYKTIIFHCKNYIPHLFFHVQNVFLRDKFFHHDKKILNHLKRNLVQTNCGFIVCYDIDNVNIEVIPHSKRAHWPLHYRCG